MSNSRTLICLGMHRSGTSLVASWLYKCNLHLGNRLLEPDHSNEKGHYEDMDFLNLHEEILEFNNISKYGLTPPFDIKIDRYHYNKIKNLVNYKNSQHVEWGWKEPRTCLLVDCYKEILPNAKYIIIYRDYPLVVDSLIRRDLKVLHEWFKKLKFFSKIKKALYFFRNRSQITFNQNTYLKTWIIYNKKLFDLMMSLNKDDFIFIDYDSLIKHDEKIFAKLLAWHFNLNFHPFSSVFDVKLMNNQISKMVFDPELEKEALVIKDMMLEFK